MRKKSGALIVAGVIIFVLSFFIGAVSGKSKHNAGAKQPAVKSGVSVRAAAAASPKTREVAKTGRHRLALSSEEISARDANRKVLSNKISNYVRNDPAWQQADVGIYIATLDRDEPVYQKNGSAPMIPASNLKAVTTAAALSLLGPEYRFSTSLWGGEIDASSGVMNGNLYLKGTGDPTFMEPFVNSPTDVFYKLAASLKSQGIREIQGDLVGDDSAFDREFLGRGWKTRYIYCDYAAPAGALSINGNIVSLIVRGDSVSMLPGNNYIKINRRYSNRSVNISRKYGTDEITVNGRNSGTVNDCITINNPSKYSTAVFREILRKNGIKVNGSVRLIKADELTYEVSSRKLAEQNSRPLYKIVRQTNKESDNICAQHLFKSIGYKLKGKGTCDNSQDAIKEWMRSAGIDSSGFVMADGSGLSTYNRISPRQIAGILAHMSDNPQWKYYWESLPVAGTDGTLIYRMKGLPVRAKTGGLQGHIALSGYVKTKAGQTVVFSILTNRHHTSGDRIRENEDRIVSMIANCWQKL